ncbi:hypothetical protein [Demequina sp.]|uniref:hypothetical protein n=1 Tax=Demequina sp. TaxID=2050685 RepID=UPI0025C3EE75|nr:hypothetical protein [Demequina sp.]
MPKRAAGAPEPTPRIRPRHEILGHEAGKAGYRHGCKCDLCRAWNAKRMRDYRAKRRTAEEPPVDVELPPAPDGLVQSVLLKDLKPGEISKALVEELPAADGAYIFQRTVSALLKQSALILDNADALDRWDLIPTMQIRVLNALKRLEPPRSGNPLGGTGPTVEDIVNAITGPSADEDGD